MCTIYRFSIGYPSGTIKLVFNKKILRSHDPVETTLVVSDLLDLISDTQIFIQANVLTQQVSPRFMLI